MRDPLDTSVVPMLVLIIPDLEFLWSSKINNQERFIHCIYKNPTTITMCQSFYWVLFIKKIYLNVGNHWERVTPKKKKNLENFFNGFILREVLWDARLHVTSFLNFFSINFLLMQTRGYLIIGLKAVIMLENKCSFKQKC